MDGTWLHGNTVKKSAYLYVVKCPECLHVFQEPSFLILFLMNLGNFLQMCVCVCAQSCLILCNAMDCSQAPLEFSRQEYWSEVPFPTPGDLSYPGIEPTSLESPALAGGFFTSSTIWEDPPQRR